MVATKTLPGGINARLQNRIILTTVAADNGIRFVGSPLANVTDAPTSKHRVAFASHYVIEGAS